MAYLRKTLEGYSRKFTSIWSAESTSTVSLTTYQTSSLLLDLSCFYSDSSDVLVPAYAILVLLILIAQLAGIALIAAFKSQVEGTFKTNLEQEFQKEYKQNQTEFRALFKKFECCGINGPQEF
ncbi:hypothetical protein KUTeg_016946 [Tegillarca granosa]|uniref:Uncharacterized protein n=1 Tax=Tegillarca granosa TaxID=220873 RepID=A0ABQ9ER72_TEGGR|nr:hypothetical protein KUTeg_016946 [Tegillarca granosa]